MCGCGIINLFTESRKVYELVLNRAINFELILNITVSDKIKKLDNTLLSNSENREHLKNFRNVDCVLANHNKVQDMQANLKTTN